MTASLFQDFRHGVRLLRRAPGFAAVAVATLAIGIGATTTIFSVLNTLLLRPLPYTDADRLAVVWEHNLPRDRPHNVVSPANFLDWREMNQSFSELAAASLTFNATLSGDGDPEDVAMQLVSAPFFPVLGVSPALGRAFSADEDRPGSRVVVISDRLWRRRFGADPNLIGRAIAVGGLPNTVVGIMPPGFAFLDKTVDLWTPIGFTAEARSARGRWLSVVGRLRPGIEVAGAQRDMAAVAARLAERHPAANAGWSARVTSMREELTGEVRPALVVLAGAVGLVLLIACANVANLLMARATARHRELAVRAALGAGRLRLVRQLLAESSVLAAAGGAAGLLLAWWAVHLLRVVVAGQLPVQRLEAVAIDGHVLAFTSLVSLLSGLLFGALPALVGPADLTGGLKEGGRGATGRRGASIRSAFVVLEVAVAMVLVVSAGLLLRSFVRLLDVDPGFAPGSTVTFRLSLPDARYDGDIRKIAFFDRLFEQVETLPGVAAAGAVSFLPLTGPGAATGFAIVGEPTPPPGQNPVADVRVVAHDYFGAMRIPLREGRLFDDRSPQDAAGRVIVNEAMARRHWPGESAVGKRIRVSWGDAVDDEVIGVVGDVRHESLETAARATVYWPYARNVYGGMTVVVRAEAPVAPVVAGLRAFIRDADPLLAVADIRGMDDVVAVSVAEQRLLLTLLAVFAGAALLLAGIGIYGVLAFAVSQRTREIGIRLALGARRSQVLRLVVGRALTLAAAGTTAGLVGAWLVTHLMTRLLYDTTPADAPTFVATAALLLAVGAVASYLPARRAAAVDPIVALRGE